MDAVSWLLVGAGDIASRRVGPALVEAAGSELLAVCDLNADRAGTLARSLGAQGVYTDYSEALADCGADAVYIATPQHTHIELSLQALAAGKHLLCEKPLGLNGAECLRLLAAARRSDRTVSCSNYRRLSEQYRVTAAMLERREIGELTGGWALYSTPFYNPGGAPLRRELGLSRLKELGFYLLDIAHNLLGVPVTAQAQASILHPEVMNDLEELATVILRFPSGALFTLIFNCTSPGTRHELELFGTAGRISWAQWPPHGNGPVITETAAGLTETAARTHTNWHLPMVEDYVAALSEGRQPVCTLESAVQTELITDAIFRSLESGRAEAVQGLPEAEG